MHYEIINFAMIHYKLRSVYLNNCNWCTKEHVGHFITPIMSEAHL